MPRWIPTGTEAHHYLWHFLPPALPPFILGKPGKAAFLSGLRLCQRTVHRVSHCVHLCLRPPLKMSACFVPFTVGLQYPTFAPWWNYHSLHGLTSFYKPFSKLFATLLCLNSRVKVSEAGKNLLVNAVYLRGIPILFFEKNAEHDCCQNWGGRIGGYQNRYTTLTHIQPFGNHHKPVMNDVASPHLLNPGSHALRSPLLSLRPHRSWMSNIPPFAVHSFPYAIIGAIKSPGSMIVVAQSCMSRLPCVFPPSKQKDSPNFARWAMFKSFLQPALTTNSVFFDPGGMLEKIKKIG